MGRPVNLLAVGVGAALGAWLRWGMGLWLATRWVDGLRIDDPFTLLLAGVLRVTGLSGVDRFFGMGFGLVQVTYARA